MHTDSLCGELERKRQFERPRHRWEDNITSKMYLTKIEWEGLDWIYLALDRGKWWAVVKTVMNFRVP
jgi:hypothetical protein